MGVEAVGGDRSYIRGSSRASRITVVLAREDLLPRGICVIAPGEGSVAPRLLGDVSPLLGRGLHATPHQ
jgi:hypothetical protein